MKMVKYQRQIRALISTHLSVLENDNSFALGGLTEEEEDGVRALVESCGLFSNEASFHTKTRRHEEKELCGLSPSEETSCIVEFGTLFGITTGLLAHYKSAKMKVITVDNFCWNPFGLTPEMHKAFTRRILRCQLAKGDVELVEMDSKTFRDTYKGRIPNMVFLDADHSYEAVRDEIAWAKKIGVPLISGHDYGNSRFGVTKAVDEAFPDGVQVKGMVWSHKG